MGEFDHFTAAVLSGSKEIAKETLKDFETITADDTTAFLKKSKVDLERWTRLLALGAITEQDFGDLVRGKGAVFELRLLGQQGVALATLERLRSRLITLVIDTAFDVFL
jgi:hypothetical protein